MIYRPALPQDAPRISQIYRHYVEHTAVTFAYDAPTEEDFRQKISTLSLTHPFLVCEQDGQVAGFAYAAPYREKEAFQWDVELTVYLDPHGQRQGMGTGLMGRVLALLKRQGFMTAYSCVTLPNAGSEALHRRFGFDTLGVHPRSGYKLGRWHDVVWLALPLGDYPAPPPPPTPFAALPAEEVSTLLA